jgi:hypothetical protein
MRSAAWRTHTSCMRAGCASLCLDTCSQCVKTDTNILYVARCINIATLIHHAHAQGGAPTLAAPSWAALHMRSHCSSRTSTTRSRGNAATRRTSTQQPSGIRSSATARPAPSLNCYAGSTTMRFVLKDLYDNRGAIKDVVLDDDEGPPSSARPSLRTWRGLPCLRTSPRALSQAAGRRPEGATWSTPSAMPSISWRTTTPC